MRALTRNEVRNIDAMAIKEFSLPGIILMENAGRGAAELLLSLGVSGTVLVCAGKGNNGGDGFVIARHLELRGIEVRILLCTSPAELTGDAAINYRVVQSAGTPIEQLPADGTHIDCNIVPENADWIVDALLGTGATGAPREPLVEVIKSINRSGRKVLAVDLPSGMDCDTGTAPGECIRATATATFVARKVGFDSPSAKQFTGDVHVIDIGIPKTLRDRVLSEGI